MQAKQINELKSEIAIKNDEYKKENRCRCHSEKLTDIIEKIVNDIRIRIASNRGVELIIRGDYIRNTHRQIEEKKDEIDDESRHHESKLFVSQLTFNMFALLLRCDLHNVTHSDFYFRLL